MCVLSFFTSFDASRVDRLHVSARKIGQICHNFTVAKPCLHVSAIIFVCHVSWNGYQTNGAAYKQRIQSNILDSSDNHLHINVQNDYDASKMHSYGI